MTQVIATRYPQADKAGKGRILDELCATTGWHRNHARKALKAALRPQIVRRRESRPPKYGPKAVVALRYCWMLLGMPAGKRLAPMLGELVPVLRRFGELDIDEDTAALLMSMSAATIDRRLATERDGDELDGCDRVTSGSARKTRTPICTRAEWDDSTPGFVDVGLVAHDGGDTAGEHIWTLTVTDIATGWTQNRSVLDNDHTSVLVALRDIARTMPFPIRGIDSGIGSELVNRHPLTWCENRQIALSCALPAEQKNWASVRAAVGDHRYHTTAELLLLNKIWALRSKLTNYFYPQQKLVAKTRVGARVARNYDTATTPHRRAEGHDAVSVEDKAILADIYARINPAAVHRQIQALTSELLTLATSKVATKTNQTRAS